jgi:nuclear pore complex protein Nup93
MLHSRAVYCVIGSCDVNDEHSEVAKAADDYLWLKLCQIREEDSTESQVTDRMTYAHLQSLILEEYGRYHNELNSLIIIAKCFCCSLCLEFCHSSVRC